MTVQSQHMANTQLWSTFELLRDETGSLEQANAIFCLLLLRLICAEADDAGRPDRSRWEVPEGARWMNWGSSSPERLGILLNEACSLLERANPLLRGRLTTFNFDSERLGSLSRRNQLLARMVQVISELPALQAVPIDYAELGVICDEVIDKLFDVDRKRLSSFITSSSIAELMAEIVAPDPGMSVYDPVCGVGRSLIACARYALRSSERKSGGPGEICDASLFGQEKNQEIWSLCRGNMLLHGFGDVGIEPGDVLRSPKLDGNKRMMRYDRVVAAPPFHLDNWGSETAASDVLRRFDPVPPKNNADYAFIQHCLASLRDEGVAAILAPMGVLFRTGVEQRIRQKIIEEDRVAAVVSLPGKILSGNSLESVILVLHGTKAPRRHEGVLFVDASEQYGMQGRSRLLRQEDIRAIIGALRRQDSPAPSQRVEIETIKRNNWNLSMNLYVRSHNLVEQVDTDEQMEAINALEARRDASAVRMDDILHRLERVLNSRH